MKGVHHVPGAADADRDALEGWFRSRGLVPRWWSNAEGDEYGWHQHPYHKVLFCQDGTIAFHTRDGDLSLSAGDRLDIEPGTEHSATVGAGGVTCVEAASPATAREES